MTATNRLVGNSSIFVTNFSRALRLFGVCSMLAVAMAACKTDDADMSSGSGGLEQNTAGSRATAGGDACNLPSCVRDALKDCTPSGTCTMSTSASAVNVCYSNGVKLLTSLTIKGTSVSAKTSATKPNGSVCYTQSIMPEQTRSKSTYMNAAGAPIATSTLDTTSGTWTVTCTGAAPVVVNVSACQGLAPANANLTVMGSGQAACAAGSCM